MVTVVTSSEGHQGAVLSRKHEDDIAGWFGGRRHAGSGNQFTKQLDGRTGFAGEWDFAWDCKAAMPGTQSITVTRTMLDKIVNQAHGRRLMLPMRFYDTERGDFFGPPRSRRRAGQRRHRHVGDPRPARRWLPLSTPRRSARASSSR